MDSKRYVQGPTGARELILECREMLAGKRQRFTPQAEYVAQRLAYWKAVADGDNGQKGGRQTNKAA